MVSSRRCSSKILQKICTVRYLLRSYITERIFCRHNNVFGHASALRRLGTHHGEFQGHSSCLKLALGPPVHQVTTWQQESPMIFNSGPIFSVLYLYNEVLTHISVSVKRKKFWANWRNLITLLRACFSPLKFIIFSINNINEIPCKILRC
jgi:hypothetical protein